MRKKRLRFSVPYILDRCSDGDCAAIHGLEWKHYNAFVTLQKHVSDDNIVSFILKLAQVTPTCRPIKHN